MVKYEWTLETLQDGDIVDSDFSDTLSFDKAELPGNDLGLVRNEGNENEGVTYRLWAYVKDGSCLIAFPIQWASLSLPSKFQKDFMKN